MDLATESKNTKYPLFVKAICLLLTVLFFLGTCGSVLYGLVAVNYVYRSRSGLNAGTFYDTNLFGDLVLDDLNDIGKALSYPQQRDKLESYREQRDELVEREVQRFLVQKATIIRAEIYYVATHYEEPASNYYYELYNREFATTTTTAPAQETMTAPTAPYEEETAAKPESRTAEENTTATTAPAQESASEQADASDDMMSPLPKVTVDERAPYDVRYCQQLCNTVSGLDWLHYEKHVRDDAFREAKFSTALDILDFDERYSFSCSEQEIRLKVGASLDKALDRAEYRNEEQDLSALTETQNLKFYAAASDGTIETNANDFVWTTQSVARHARYILCENGKVTVHLQGCALEPTIRELVESTILPTEGTLYVFFEDEFVSGDRYAAANRLFETLFVKITPKIVLYFGLMCLFGALLFFVLLMRFCGHKAGAEGITLAFIDRMPTDLHFLLSAGLIVGIVALFLLYDSAYGFPLSEIKWYTNEHDLLFDVAVYAGVLFASLAGICLVGLEWLTSTVRIKKAGLSYFGKFVIWNAFFYVVGILWAAGEDVVSFGRFVLNKPKKLSSLPFAVCALYGAGLLVVLILTFITHTLWVTILIFVLSILLVLGTIWFLRMLDDIAEAAENRTELPQEKLEKMPRCLRELAENMSLTNRELETAVADAVRNERTKTELITNVSHDLKTPLTSIISYVDLLKKCDIQDETALEYLDVLDDKSAKLKQLIEDLIEASKVNTGNVTLQCVQLDLSELVMQAVTESAPDFEKNALDLRFTPPQHAPIVFADGQKTHRILDNLLSNAGKYSATGSRVYVKVDENDTFGVVEIKNISREPLDVEPDELMERFVRGDRSRTQDGNGLGLSIAQQLSVLQGGRLELSIDGDLFKATVYLPKQSKEPAETESEAAE